MNPSTFNFFDLYTRAAENASALASDKENVRSPKKKSKSSHEVPSDRPTPSKKNKRRSDSSLGPVSGEFSKITSTPLAYQFNRKIKTPTAGESIQMATSANKSEKSILRKSESDQMNDTIIALGLDKPKKRNKSVSFVLEDDEVAGKKRKSSETPNTSTGNGAIQEEPKSNKKKNKKKPHNFSTVATTAKADGSRENNANAGEPEITPYKNKHKKSNKQVITETTDVGIGSSELILGQKESNRNNKSNKNKIHKMPPHAIMEQVPVEQPKTKRNKRQKLTENIEENLENLFIGDNANAIANLLDDMKVVDKPKKGNRNKKNKTNSEKKNATTDSSSTADVDADKTSAHVEAIGKKKKWKKSKKDKSKSEENQEMKVAEPEGEAAKKERVTWHKRKWNKDRKAEPSEKLSSMVIVENLPLSMMLTYRKLLSEHFTIHGLVKNVGIIECYPTEESRPVFTTTVQFDSDEAATQALEEDNMLVCDARVRVRRPLPPTETTLAVRCYRGCSQQSMSSIFAPCGRIRSIREVAKGPAANIATAFVEFDGPEAVEKALKLATEARIGGKKVHASRFEQRGRRKRQRKSSGGTDADVQSDQEAD